MGDPEQVSGSNVSSSLFGVLRVTPLLGRLFTEEDDHPTAAPVVVISYASWRGRFHADPAILGRMIVLDGVPRAIVGVLPRGVRYPVTDSRGEVFSPLGLLESEPRRARQPLRDGPRPTKGRRAAAPGAGRSGPSRRAPRHRVPGDQPGCAGARGAVRGPRHRHPPPRCSVRSGER